MASQIMDQCHFRGLKPGFKRFRLGEGDAASPLEVEEGSAPDNPDSERDDPISELDKSGSEPKFSFNPKDSIDELNG
jgi:hypothetical protein